MPPQETAPINPQFIQPVIAPLPKPHRAIWKIVVEIVGYILSVLVGVGIVGGIGIGCAFGNSGFTCQRLLPFSAGMGIILIVLVVSLLYKPTRSLVKKIYWTVFLVWVLLIALIAVLPERARQTYVYGMTKQSCELGRPSVPWGYIYKDHDNCLAAVGDCFGAHSYNNYCFEKSDQKVTSPEQCEVFKNGAENCKKDFALKTGDVGYCNMLADATQTQPVGESAWNKYSCARDFAFPNEFFDEGLEQYLEDKTKGDTLKGDKWDKYAKYGKEFCSQYGTGLKQDVCLFQASIEGSPTKNVCRDIQTDWLKASCVVYMDDRMK